MKVKNKLKRTLMTLMMLLMVGTTTVSVHAEDPFAIFEEDNSSNAFQPLINLFGSFAKDAYDAVTLFIFLAALPVLAGLVFLFNITKRGEKRSEIILRAIFILGGIAASSMLVYLAKAAFKFGQVVETQTSSIIDVAHHISSLM